MTPAWVRPVGRAISWAPLAAIASLLALAAGLSAHSGTSPDGLLGVAAAGLAAAVVAGLRDPAAALLAAVPVPAGVRRGQRLALLVPAALACWLGWVGVGHRWAPELGWPLAGLCALTLAGLAAAVWAPPPWGVAVGVAVPLAWVAAARAGDFAWDLHAEAVVVVAGAALWLGRDR